MPSVFPDTIQAQIEFCEQHLPVWQAAPATAIGLTTAQLTNLATATTAARDAYNAASAARLASKGATSTLRGAMSDLRETVADLVKFIKAFAESQPTPGAIYGLAQINEPSPPQPLPAPGKPEQFNVSLEPGGAITLSWAGEFSAASSGSFYNVYRKLPGQTEFGLIGGASGSTSESRRMKFTDASVPSSAAGLGASYIVQGQRGSNLGLASDILTVEFGMDSGGGAVQGGGGGGVTLKTAPATEGDQANLRVAA